VGTVTLTATLSATTTSTISIPFAVTAPSTASEGSLQDYTISASPLVIPAGATSADITITINDDSTLEPDETLIIAMGTPVNATAGATTTHTLTILANDSIGAFSITGITGGVDSTSDAWLLDTANVPTLNWTDATGETSYDVVIYEQDGTTVKCPLVNKAADVTSHTFSSCALSNGSSYKASVTAKYASETRTATNNSFLFSTTPASPQQTNVFGATTPVTPDGGTSPEVELGMRFRTTVAGQILGVRFYKHAWNTGSHSGTLWTNAGAELATVAFSGESASGWQEQLFATPVFISADTSYVISYHLEQGHYSTHNNGFASEIVNGTDGYVRGLADGYDGANGLYKYGTRSFPDQTYASSNFYVDVIFARVSPAPNAFTISGVSGGSDTTSDTTLDDSAAPDLTWTASYGAATYEATIYESDGTTVKCATATLSVPTIHHEFTGCSLTDGTTYKAKVIAKDASSTPTAATNSLLTFQTQFP
jgi:hypothetical protein